MKLSKGLIIGTIAMVISILILGYFFRDYMIHKQNSMIQQRIDNHLENLLDKIRDRKNIILTASVLLSYDSDVKKCLRDTKRDECKDHLKEIQTKFDSISFSKNIKIHVHTSDLKSFFRVWDFENIKNDSLMFFRDSLQMIKENKKELAGIEIGRFSMLMRGISPILDGDEYLGSIEVISDFDKITKDLKKRDIDFYVLMDKKYQQISTKVSYLKQNYINKYIVINSVNSELNIFSEVVFKGTGYKATKNHYVIYTPIYDIAGEKIGFYVLKILKSKL